MKTGESVSEIELQNLKSLDQNDLGSGSVIFGGNDTFCGGSMSSKSYCQASPFENRFIYLNLCGKVFQLDALRVAQSRCESLLKRFVLCSEAERADIADYYCSDSKSYYFWRNPMLFQFILQYHITGKLHCPSTLCPEFFLEELKFWQIDQDSISFCCKNKLLLQLENYEDGVEISCSRRSSAFTKFVPTPSDDELDQFESLCCSKPRRFLWDVLEHPGSSPVAKGFAFWSVGLIVVSIVALILGSMSQFQKKMDKEPMDALVYLEYACVVWFTIEYCIRLLVTPNKCQFIKDVVNIMDAFSIFPFHVEFCLLASGRATTDDLRNVKGALLAMRILRVMRVTRVFKLARYSPGLQSFIRTLGSSHEELKMLMMFLSSCVLLFSTTIYFMEKDAKDSPFTSIPATFWWAVVTMTTVGYGDMIPVTFGGKLIASFATIAGVIILAFPITMIVENFCQHYQSKQPRRKNTNDEFFQRKRKYHVKSAAIL